MMQWRNFLEHKAYQLRRWSIIMPAEAGSGHPTTCLSAADIVAVLFFYAMRYNPANFHDPNNDRFILSKGHASALLYAAWKEVGVLTEDDVLTYRAFDSVLEGHPTFRFSHTEAATGSLGIGLSIGAGMAINARIDKRDYRTYVLMGDSELAEGSVWEAAAVAAHYELSNMIGILDCNRLGQSGQTMQGHNINKYVQMFSAFGWKTFVVDGHDIAELMHVCDQAREVQGQPSIIIAKTLKGYGVDIAENKEGFHGKPFTKDQLADVLSRLERRFTHAASYTLKEVWTPNLPVHTERAVHIAPEKTVLADPAYQLGDMAATRKVYGQALAALGDVNDRVVALDAEVKNSTYADIFEAKHKERFVQCFIAEQNMVSMAVGLALRGKLAYASTFGAFFTRAHDQIRMAAIGQSNIKLVGSHCGVSIGEDGPSQMALEDIAMMRALPESIVLYPSDAVSTYKLVQQSAHYDKGITYLRTTRAATPVIYADDEEFPIGGCKVIKESDHDHVCVVAAGITLFEALKAYDELLLGEKQVRISIIDLYSVKPLDGETLLRVGRASGNKIVTVEDHYYEGGIGEAVTAAVCCSGIKVHRLAVSGLPRSGKPEELLAYHGIDAHAIVARVRDILWS